MPKLDINPVAGPVAQPRANPVDFGAQVGAQLQGAGRQVSALSQIPAAMSEMAARRKATEYSLRLQDEANALSLDNDLENREKNFDKIEQKLSGEFRKGVGSPAIFDAHSRANTGQVRNGLMQKTRVSMVEKGVNDLGETLEMLSDRSALSDDLATEGLFEVEAETIIERARETGLISDVDVDKFRDKYRKDRRSGALRRLQNDNPALGLRVLDSGNFDGTEAERQVWRSHMKSAMRSRLSSELTAIRRDDALAARRDKMLAEQAEKDLIELSFQGGFTPEDVLQFERQLSPARFASLMQVAHQGGKFVATQSNPRAYDELRVAAMESASEVQVGDGTASFEDALRTAYFNGQITQTDYKGLLKLADDRSVGQFVDLIGDTIAGGLQPPQGAKLKAMEAERSFIDWIEAREAEGGTPTLVEKQEMAEDLIRAAELVDTSGNRAFERRPLYAVTVPGSNDIDIEATIRQTLERVQDGTLPMSMLASERRRIEEFEASQKRKAKNAEARTRGGRQ